MISFKNCKIGYPDKVIFENLNLSFKRDAITAILGPNGCGKTTLLTAIMTSKMILSGALCVDGENVRSMPPKRLAAKIAVVPQMQHYAFDFLSRDMVLMGRNPHMGLAPQPNDLKVVETTLEELNISHLGSKMYSMISGGERQMVNIARAVAQDSPVILMDEPTSYLDLKNQSVVMKLIRRLNQAYGKMVVMTLHDPSQAKSFCDEVIFIEAGSVYNHGGAELIEPETIRKIYGIESVMVEIKGKQHLAPLWDESE